VRVLALGLVLGLGGGAGCRGEATTPPAPAGGTTTEDRAASGPDASRVGFAPQAELEPQGPRQRPEPEPVRTRDEALVAVVTGNPEGAIEFLVEHLESNRTDLEARLALARAQIATGAYDDAHKTLEPSTDDPRVVLARAELHRLRGDPRAAQTVLEAGLAKRPDMLELRGALLELLHATGREREPRARELMEGLYDAYEAGKAKSAAELLAVAMAALARGTSGAYHDANMVLEDAEAREPVKDGSWVADRVLLVRGHMFLEKYATDEAAATFGLILERDPWNPEALVGLALAAVAELQFAEASRLAQETLAVNPHHPDAHAVLARIALIEGRRDEAQTRIQDHVLRVNALHGPGLSVMAGLAIARQSRPEYVQWRDRALTFNPKNGAFFKDLSEILGFLHLYPEADEILTEGAKLAPDDPYVRAALGLNLLRLGHEARGREALAEAWKRDRFNQRTLNTLDLYEQKIDPNYVGRDVGQFWIRLPKQDREFVEPVLIASAKASKTALDGHYRTKVGPLRLEFFAAPDEFSVRTVGVPSLGAVAVCFGPVITFIGPYHGIHNIDNVIRHELAHVYAIERSKGRVPRWFTEGLSEWESEQADPAFARESAELLQQARRAGKLRRLSDLELAFIRAESAAMMEVAYSTAAYAIRYLGQTYGRDALLKILDGYGRGEETATLFVSVLGKELSVIEKEFETWFFAELDARIGGWQPAAAEEARDERDAKYRRALELAERGETADAIRTLETLIAEGGDGYPSRMLLAKLVLGGPSPAAAERHLEAARRHHREAIEPLVQLATLARDQNDVAAEKKWLLAGLEIDADALDPAARLLALSVVTDDRPTAARALARARAIAPLHPMILAARAQAKARTGDPADAKALLARARTSLEHMAPGRSMGPADTFAVTAVVAAELGDRKGAAELAELARKAGKLSPVFDQKLAGLTRP
jgi:cellulose synthase operon protein C